MSTYAFVNPVVALLLAWMAGDGQLSARTAIAAALVVGAVVFAREPARRAEPEAAGQQAGTSEGELLYD